MRVLLRNFPNYVQTWTSLQISTDTHPLYGRRTPTNEATIFENILNFDLRENAAVDTKMLRISHIRWASISLDTSKNWIGR